jgi:transposase-like protein
LSPLAETEHQGRERDDDVTRPYSEAFKQKMMQRLIGKDAVSANLSRETGVRRRNLSRWLAEARSLPVENLPLIADRQEAQRADHGPIEWVEVDRRLVPPLTIVSGAGHQHLDGGTIDCEMAMDGNAD